MHNMPTLKSSSSLSYLCGLSMIKKKNVNSLMWSSCMSRNEQKEIVHLYRSLTLSNAPKEIKLMELYPIALAIWCLLLL